MLFGEYLQQQAVGFDINAPRPKKEPGDLVRGMVTVQTRKINFALITDMAHLLSRLSNSGVILSLPLAKDILDTWDQFLMDPLLADAPAEIPEPEPETRKSQLCNGRTVRRIVNGIEQ